VSRREAILHRVDFAQKLDIQNALIVNHAAETPTDFRAPPNGVNSLRWAS
jgi:hypothetical protein